MKPLRTAIFSWITDWCPLTKKQAHGLRLDLIYKGISGVITKHSPEVVAIERLFFATNALTAIAVGQAIGVIKLAVHHAGLPIFDYAPMQVKMIITGSGKADKKEIKSTIKKIFKIREKGGKKPILTIPPTP